MNSKKLLLSLLLGFISIPVFATQPITHSATHRKKTVNAQAGQHQKKISKAPAKVQMDIPYLSWLPNDSINIVLLCVHGLGLNSRAYENFGERLSKLGVATYAIDVRGFGHWMKVEGKEKIDFDSCLSDIEKSLKALHTAYPKTPVYILGESMGGAIALRVTAVHPELVDGLISAVPSGDRFHKTRNQLRVAMRLVTGRKNQPMDVGEHVLEQATDDQTLRDRWKDDPLNRLQLTPKELMQFQSFMNENHDAAEQIDHKPVLVICGFKDRLVKPQGTIDLFNELATPDKMLVILGNGEHLIFEQGQLTDQACWVLMGWLNNHRGGHKLASVPHKAIYH